MVSQKENALSPQGEPDFEALAKQMDAAGEFDDSTQPEVDAAEAEAPETVEESNSEATPQPEPETQTPAPEAVEPPAAATEDPTRPKVRLTDLPEFREYQSKKDREIAEIKQKLDQQEQEKKQAATQREIESQVETHLQSEERRLTLSGMTSEDAKAAARDPQFVKTVRDHFTGLESQKTAQQREQLFMQALEQAGRQIEAARHIRTYSLSEEDGQLLMTANSPEAMEALAKRLGQRRTEEQQRRDDRRSLVPRETAATRLENGTSDAPVKPGFWDLLESAGSKNWDEMTPAERAALEQLMK